MKKLQIGFIVMIMLCFVMIFSGWVLAQEKSKYAGQTIHVAMAWEPREEALKNLTKEFEEKTGIKVVVDLLGNVDMKPKMLSVLQAKSSEYDVVQFDYALMPFCVDSGWLLDLTDWVNRDSKEVQPDDFHPALYNTHIKYKDRWYGFPLHVNSGCLFYRTDIMKEMGFEPPKNWDEAMKDIKAINEKYAPNPYGISFMGAPDPLLAIEFQSLLTSQGVDYYDKKTFEPQVNTPGGEKALNILLEMKKYAPEGVTGYSLDQSYDAFAQGKAAMSFGFTHGVWFFADPAKSKVVGKFDVMALPGGHSILGGWFVAISQFSSNKEAAWEWVKWATSEEMERKLLGNMECPRLSILKDPEVQKKWPNNKVFFETLEQSPTIMPQIKSIVELWMKCAVTLNEVLNGSIEPKPALERMDQEFREILSRDGYLKQ
ncbi:MAG: sugar ABC transporter substrate-binding protein [Candidatus Atribacteria bacterium]|nr:sugar ABC transporter substrate-binding protein [Candidatus Atribacteria bacterium]